MNWDKPCMNEAYLLLLLLCVLTTSRGWSVSHLIDHAVHINNSRHRRQQMRDKGISHTWLRFSTCCVWFREEEGIWIEQCIRSVGFINESGIRILYPFHNALTVVRSTLRWCCSIIIPYVLKMKGRNCCRLGDKHAVRRVKPRILDRQNLRFQIQTEYCDYGIEQTRNWTCGMQIVRWLPTLQLVVPLQMMAMSGNEAYSTGHSTLWGGGWKQQ